MKRGIIGLSIGVVLSLSSCGDESVSALDIDVQGLSTACEAVDALNQISDEMIEMIGEDGVTDAEKEVFDKLSAKAEEVDDYAQNNFEREDAQACENWEEMRTKGGDLSDYR